MALGLALTVSVLPVGTGFASELILIVLASRLEEPVGSVVAQAQREPKSRQWSSPGFSSSTNSSPQVAPGHPWDGRI